MISNKNRQIDLSELKHLLGADSESEVRSGLVTIWRPDALIPCGVITGSCAQTYNFSPCVRIPGATQSEEIRLNMHVYFTARPSSNDQKGWTPPSVICWVARNDLPKSFFKPETLLDFLSRAYFQWRTRSVLKRMSS